MRSVEVPSDAEYLAFRACPLFRGVPEALCRAAWEDPLCTIQVFESGEQIPAGCGRIGILLTGSAYAEKSAEGNRTLLRLLPTGSLFGVAALYHDCGIPVTELTARTRTATAFLPEAVVDRLFAASPAAAKNYIVFLTQRIRYLNARIDAFTAGSAVARLRHYLCSLVSPEDLPCTVPVTCSRLAAMLDIGRASLYRALDTLASAGAVTKTGKSLLLLPPLFAGTPVPQEIGNQAQACKPITERSKKADP